MITVLAVDQSLTGTGVVVMDFMYRQGEDNSPVGEVIHSEVIRTSKDHEDWLIDAHKRSVEIARRIHAIADEHRPTHVVFETPSLGSSGRATRTLPLLLGIITSMFVNFEHVPPTTLKKFATGSGNADKKQMVEAIEPLNPEFYKWLMEMPKTKGRYDLADAFWLATYIAEKE